MLGGVIMKKILIVLLCTLTLFLVGSKDNTNNIKADNNDTQVIDSKVDNNTQEMDKKIEEEKEIKLNEPYQVKRTGGEYNFTIKSVTKTNWWERTNENKDKTVILLNLECENISFKDELYDGVSLYDAFTLKDNNNIYVI